MFESDELYELVPEHYRHWLRDFQLLATRLRQEPTEYYKEAAAILEALEEITIEGNV